MSRGAPRWMIMVIFVLKIKKSVIPVNYKYFPFLTRSSTLAMESIHPHDLSHGFVKFWRSPRLCQNPILDGPASSPHGPFRSFLPERVRPVKALKKGSSGEKFTVNLLHKLLPLQVSETQSFIMNGIMVEKSFTGYDPGHQTGGKTLQ